MSDDAGTVFNNLIAEYETIKERVEQEQQGFPKPASAGQFYLRVDTGELFIAALAPDNRLRWIPVTNPTSSQKTWI